jgi:potassium-transporting ATPase KdpC subunit
MHSINLGQMHRINVCGISQNVLQTLIQLNIERNKITNGLFFAPQYVNVLEVNLDLVKQYPEHYQEFLNNLNRR